MLVELFTNPIFILIEFLIQLFPLLAFPVDIIEGIFVLLNMANTLEQFVPVYFCMLLVGAYWSIVNGKLFISIVIWVYERIPFI